MSQASLAHEAPLEVLRQAPDTVLELLRAFGVDFGPSTVEAVDTDLTDAVPSHRAADFVGLVRADGHAIAAVIVEVQLAPDPEKASSWARYITHVQSRHGVPTTLIVLSPHRHVARWVARLPQYSPSLRLSPRVVGPDELVALVEESNAPLASPLAILAALADFTEAGAHPTTKGDEARLGVRVFEALAATSPSEEQFLRLSLLQGAAPSRFHARLNEILEAASMDIRQLIHDKGRLEGRAEGKLEGRAEGRLEGRVEGKLEGRAEGKLEGRAEGKVEALMRILEARDIPVDASTERRIHAERDLARLDRWLVNALTATVVDDLFH